jgi:AraC-like DNA-binding protein
MPLSPDRISPRPSALPGLTALEARFDRFAFTPHRHETYTIGLTTHGVQQFTYRGSTHRSLLGQAFVLHPDEMHDGCAGDESGYGFLALYPDPSLIRTALQSASLPFLPDPVSSTPRLTDAIRAVFQASEAADDLAVLDAVTLLADALHPSAAPGPATSSASRRSQGMKRVLDLLRGITDRRLSADEIEADAGLSRWEIARRFRAATGTSLARFHLTRRLEAAQHMIASGKGLAEAAASCGFADQAHLTRSFRRQYGLTPGHWRTMSGATNPDAEQKG